MSTGVSLGEIVRDRLASSNLVDAQRALVEGALVDGAVKSLAVGNGVASKMHTEVFLTGLTVEGFRGIGPKVSVALRPGAGLTVITGRNGSGKSSLAESMELLLTGDNARWSDGKNTDLRKSWKNLHYQGDTKIEMELSAMGSPMIVLSRHWTDAQLDSSASMVKLPGKDPAPIDSLGWSQALKTYRPFLSYGELGGLLEDGPSHLHDAIANILGLEEFTRIKDVLTAKKATLSAQTKEAKLSWTALATELAALNDPRAAAIVTATTKKGWSVSAVEALLSDDTTDHETTAGWCRSVLSIPPLSLDGLAQLVDTAQNASTMLEAFHGSDAQTALSTATLLEQAIALHRSVHLRDCPVCGTESILDDAWLTNAQADVARLHTEASAVKAAVQALSSAERQLRQCVPVIPGVLSQPPAEIDDTVRSLTGELQAEWQAAVGTFQSRELAKLIQQATSTAQSINGHFGALKVAVEAVLESADSEWTPLARKIRAWCAKASEAGDLDSQLKDVTAAEAWVVKLSNEFRDERLAPIRSSVEGVWNDLRCDSNIALASFELGGKGTRRRVDLSLTVDDTPAPTLGVLSQGEMHALALSMFLPRAALDESPFRFLVIDDPVQAMDPSKVDGLARQLAKVAKTRQVVVLTHDDRLPEAMRRLDIDARVLEVVRGAKSGVQVERSMDPTDRRLKAARDLLKEKNLPADIRTQVVAAQCRQALEAECIDLLQVRMIRAGMAMAKVDETLEAANTLNDLLSLLVMNDRKRLDEAKMLIEQRMPGARNLISQIQTAAHAGSGATAIPIEPGSLIEGAGKLVKTLRSMESA